MFHIRHILISLAFINFTQPVFASQDQGSLAPSTDAISACYAHSEGSSCSYRDEKAVYVSGNCRKLSENKRKVCTDTRPSS